MLYNLCDLITKDAQSAYSVGNFKDVGFVGLLILLGHEVAQKNEANLIQKALKSFGHLIMSPTRCFRDCAVLLFGNLRTNMPIKVHVVFDSILFSCSGRRPFIPYSACLQGPMSCAEGNRQNKRVNLTVRDKF